MRRFTVEPGELRRAAKAVDHLADDVQGAVAVADARELGHAGLRAAVSEFMKALSGGWSELVSQTETVASSLRVTAEIYERADDEGASATRAVTF